MNHIKPSKLGYLLMPAIVIWILSVLLIIVNFILLASEPSLLDLTSIRVSLYSVIIVMALFGCALINLFNGIYFFKNTKTEFKKQFNVNKKLPVWLLFIPIANIVFLFLYFKLVRPISNKNPILMVLLSLGWFIGLQILIIVPTLIMADDSYDISVADYFVFWNVSSIDGWIMTYIVYISIPMTASIPMIMTQARFNNFANNKSNHSPSSNPQGHAHNPQNYHNPQTVNQFPRHQQQPQMPQGNIPSNQPRPPASPYPAGQPPQSWSQQPPNNPINKPK